MFLQIWNFRGYFIFLFTLKIIFLASASTILFKKNNIFLRIRCEFQWSYKDYAVFQKYYCFRTKKLNTQKEASHESQIRKELFPPKRSVSNRAIFDSTYFRHESMSQLNRMKQFCYILCKLFILFTFFLIQKDFLLLTYI